VQPSGPNAEQIAYWNEQSGPRWVAQEARLDATFGELGHAALARAAPRPGERVLDVGCGCGGTTLELAAGVGTDGEAVGIDVSSLMLARARERARAAGVRARFLDADAQTHRFEGGGFDLIYSRLGVMFFADPVAAFRNLLGALRPGGRLCFLCWQALARNPWMRVPLEAVARHAPLPPMLAPGAPGPFAFADAGRVRSILEQAGFAEVRLEPLERELVLGGEPSLEGAVRFALEGVGPAVAALREASAEVRAAAARSVAEALAPYAGPQGVLLPSAAWIATARRP
jgi:SAM-dependent methyltransferase